MNRPANNQPPKTGSSNAQKAGVVGGLAAMMAIAAPFITSWEGKKNDPYVDSVGVKTVCIGETRVAMRRYTDAECLAMLEKAIPEYALPVAAASPGIENSKYEWAAHTAFAYNVGVGAYNKSSVRKLYNAGDYVGACRFMRQYNKGGGRVIMGLQYRREGKDYRIGEYELCLAGAIPKVTG